MIPHVSSRIHPQDPQVPVSTLGLFLSMQHAMDQPKARKKQGNQFRGGDQCKSIGAALKTTKTNRKQKETKENLGEPGEGREAVILHWLPHRLLGAHKRVLMLACRVQWISPRQRKTY